MTPVSSIPSHTVHIRPPQFHDFKMFCCLTKYGQSEAEAKPDSMIVYFEVLYYRGMPLVCSTPLQEKIHAIKCKATVKAF